jgi:hypothetical protein
MQYLLLFVEKNGKFCPMARIEDGEGQSVEWGYGKWINPIDPNQAGQTS